LPLLVVHFILLTQISSQLTSNHFAIKSANLFMLMIRLLPDEVSNSGDYETLSKVIFFIF